MKRWQDTLTKRWEVLREKGFALGWHGGDSPRLADIAERHGLEWYTSRSQDEVGEFMPYDAEGLFNHVVGFGFKKCQRLIEILEAEAGDENMPVDLESLNGEKKPTADCADVLEEWGIPFTYPVHLLPLSARLLKFCEVQGAVTLIDLLKVWFQKREIGMLACENIGRRSVSELKAIASAIIGRDSRAVRQWLPLNDSEDGLCIRRALTLNYDILSKQTLTVLKRRLIDKMTLEESVVQFGITRERARQYEAAFLRDIRSVLEWFRPQHQEILDKWMEHGDWKGSLLPLPRPESETLILAGIEAVFEDSPQGIARRLEDEVSEETRMELLWNHVDLHLGGVDLQSFLDEFVPEPEQTDFIARICEVRGLLIDQGSGLIKPSSPSVRDTLLAILNQEVEPIPLTWLAMRVQSIEGCEEGDVDFILRNRYRWSQLGFLDLAKVLWQE